MPSPSLFLGSSATLVSVLSLLSKSASALSVPRATAETYYALDTEYSGTSFFDGFNFYSAADPTHGFVTYTSATTARRSGLITFDNGRAQMRVDSENTYDGSGGPDSYWDQNGVGRPSVRIESQSTWTKGLFVADILHMPTTKTTNGCGTWPAFWTLGSGTWPWNGEIDILEGANDQNPALSALHTGNQCVVQQSPLQMTGSANGNDCRYDTVTGANGAGCGALDQRPASYGPDFNSANGGVFAMEWKSDAIKIWFFPRNQIPSDLTAETPDPSGWGLPAAIYNGPGCDIDANFADHRIIFDTTFCGDFGEATWFNGCSAKTNEDMCSVFVGDNPEEFTEAYWDINYVKVFQLTEKIHSSSTTSSSTTSTRSTSSRSTVSTSVSTTSSHSTSSSYSTSSSLTTTSSRSRTTLSSTTSHSFGPFPNGTATTTEGPKSTSSEGPATTDVDHTWEDWSSSTSLTVDPATTTDHTWADWTSTSSPIVDPAATTSGYTWADWTSTTAHCGPTTTSTVSCSVGGGKPGCTTSTITVYPAGCTSTTTTETSDYTWADWTSTPSSPVDPVTSPSAPTTWADWQTTGTTPVDPVTSPSDPATWFDWTTSTAAATTPVAPVNSSPVHPYGPGSSETNVDPVGGSSTGPSPATYTGAAGRNAVSVMAAGAVVLAAALM